MRRPAVVLGLALLVAPAALAQNSLVVPGAHVLDTDIAIGPDGRAVVLWLDGNDALLKVTRCADVPCTSGTTVAVDGGFNVGTVSSITIGSDGLPLIAYYDAPNEQDLKVAHCNDPGCAAVTLSTIAKEGNVGGRNVVVRGTDGLGLIAYADVTQARVMVAHCLDLACTTATHSVVDAASGNHLGFTIGGDGLGLLSYDDVQTGELRVAHCGDAACTSATVSVLDGGGIEGSGSLTTGADGLGLFAYWRGSPSVPADLRVAHCDNPACTSATLSPVGRVDPAPTTVSIQVGSDGRVRLRSGS